MLFVVEFDVHTHGACEHECVRAMRAFEGLRVVSTRMFVELFEASKSGLA